MVRQGTGVNRSTFPKLIKDLPIDPDKIRQARRLLGASTVCETIDRALDFAIRELERNRKANKAHDRFLQSGIQIRDLFGKLED